MMVIFWKVKAVEVINDCIIENRKDEGINI
jgi:hypothetical protein